MLKLDLGEEIKELITASKARVDGGSDQAGWLTDAGAVFELGR